MLCCCSAVVACRDRCLVVVRRSTYRAGSKVSHHIGWKAWRTSVIVLAFLLYAQVCVRVCVCVCVCVCYVLTVHCSRVVAHVQISTEALRLLNCSEEVDGVSYLKADFHIDCASAERRGNAVAAAVVLVVFSLGVPLMSAVLLRRSLQRQSQARSKGRAALQFLIDGFKDRYYYWECVQMLRKFLIVAVSVLTSGTTLQLALGMGIVCIFLVLQAMANPFKNRIQDSLELAAHSAAATTLCTLPATTPVILISIGAPPLTYDLDVLSSPDGGWMLTLDISAGVAIATQVVIVAVNVAVLLVWGFQFGRETVRQGTLFILPCELRLT